MSTCTLCGKNAQLKEKNCKGYQEPLTFDIYYCHTCNSSFALPWVDVKEIYNNIYKQSKVIPGYNRYFKYANNIKKYNSPLNYLMESESTYWAVGVALEKISLNNKSLKILEIGSGLGYLTYALKKSGYDILGLDISEKAVSEAINMFGDNYVCEDIFNYSKTHSNIYDIVILTEVIEHIENPLVFINEILKLIKPGGSIILTTPNKSLFPSTVHWKTELPPVHYWWLSEDSILNICLKLNSTCSFINFKEYYNNNYKSFNILKYKKNLFEDSILNIVGELKLAHNTELSKHRSWFHNLILFMFIKNIFRYLRDLLNPNFVRCGVRGDVLCAIVNKNINK